jgi:hypothetical protein
MLICFLKMTGTKSMERAVTSPLGLIVALTLKTGLLSLEWLQDKAERKLFKPPSEDCSSKE